MKKIISMVMALILFLSLLCVTAFAAGESASLTGPGTVRAGDTITLTFHLNGTDIFGASGTLSYDTNQLELQKTKQIIGSPWMVEFNGNNFVAYDNNLTNPINSNTALFTVTFKVKSGVATGANILVSYTGVTASDGTADANIGTVTYSATVAALMSTDNTLKSLTVSNAAISPAFDPNVTTYTASVPFATQRLDVSVVPAAEATVNVSSPNLTPGGTTKVTITVTAENGESKVYTIHTFRAQDPNYVESSNNNLSSIKVQGFLLSPVFDTKVTEYVVWLPYETESVSVSATSADDKASVRIEGGKDLVAGADNEIKVICVAEDGTEKVYTVIAKRAAAHVGSTEPTEPSVEPTEPSTEPSAPSTQPGNPAPTEPQEPADTEKTDGIPWWVLLIVGIVCLAGGVAAGIFVDKKYLNKK